MLVIDLYLPICDKNTISILHCNNGSLDFKLISIITTRVLVSSALLAIQVATRYTEESVKQTDGYSLSHGIKFYNGIMPRLSQFHVSLFWCSLVFFAHWGNGALSSKLAVVLYWDLVMWGASYVCDVAMCLLINSREGFYKGGPAWLEKMSFFLGTQSKFPSNIAKFPSISLCISLF